MNETGAVVTDQQAAELRRSLGLLTEEETAAIADVDLATLRNQRSARTGPPYTRWGRKVFYRQAALVKWLEGREEATQP